MFKSSDPEIYQLSHPQVEIGLDAKGLGSNIGENRIVVVQNCLIANESVQDILVFFREHDTVIVERRDRRSTCRRDIFKRTDHQCLEKRETDFPLLSRVRFHTMQHEMCFG